MTTELYNRPILLVEDNPMDIDLTLRAFKKCQISRPTVVARDGEEALNHVSRWSDPESRPIVVLLDLKLPRIDGLEVLNKIKSNLETKSVPVVVMSSSAEESDVRAAYQNGANSYIVKPIDFGRFLDAVSQLQTYWCDLNERCP